MDKERWWVCPGQSAKKIWNAYKNACHRTLFRREINKILFKDDTRRLQWQNKLWTKAFDARIISWCKYFSKLVLVTRRTAADKVSKKQTKSNNQLWNLLFFHPDDVALKASWMVKEIKAKWRRARRDKALVMSTMKSMTKSATTCIIASSVQNTRSEWVSFVVQGGSRWIMATFTRTMQIDASAQVNRKMWQESSSSRNETDA